MPEITITLTVTAGTVNAGEWVLGGSWSAGFDHAALVTALRSRSDAKDFRLHHTGHGRIPSFAVSGANTTNCRISWESVIDATGVDAGYRLFFGDLGAQTTVTSVTGAGTAATISVAASVPALALPAPGFPLERIEVADVVGIPWGASLTTRTARQNHNDRKIYRCRWAPGITAEDWYAIRAVVNSTLGPAGTITAPSWLGGSESYRIVETSPHDIYMAESFGTALVLAEVIA